jgi:hypothetical protein
MIISPASVASTPELLRTNRLRNPQHLCSLAHALVLHDHGKIKQFARINELAR